MKIGDSRVGDVGVLTGRPTEHARSWTSRRSNPARSVRRISCIALWPLVALSAALGVITPAVAQSTSPPWQTAWTSPTDLNYGNTYNSTTRDIATVPVAGSSLRLIFSNLWSSTPTTFSAVTVGAQQSGPDVIPGTFVPVTFNHGSRSVTIAPYGRVVSDPVPFAVHAGESIAVSMATLGAATVSAHTCCSGPIDSYATSDGVGNLTLSPTAAGFNPLISSTFMRWLSVIQVAGSPAQGTVVAFGDSITDGFGYLNQGFSWVNAMQARIAHLPPSEQVVVVNSGIAGDTLTVFPPHDSYAEGSGGLPGVTRLNMDALSLPGVKSIVLLLGTNDIWFGAGGVTGHPIPPYGTAPSIEAGMRQVVNAAHAHHVKIFGVTLLPRSTSTAADHDLPENWTPAEQATLTAVNTWMLSPHTPFDKVINLNAVMSDVYNGDCRPTIPFAPYFNPDHLHPNVAGETIMADAISTTLFGIAQAPQVAPLVTATPTRDCPAAQLAAQVLAAGRQPATPPTTTTTTITTTTTMPASTNYSSMAKRILEVALLVLVVLLVVALWNARRRALRRRAARRRTQRPRSHPRPPGPPRSPPPPRRGPGPRRT